MFGRKILAIRTKSALKKDNTLRESQPYYKAKYIGILFSAENKEKYEEIYRLVKDLELEGKKVTVLSYLGKGKENYDFRFDVFTSSDISIWGRFMPALVLSFIDQPFDYLYCLDRKVNIYLENILANSKAKCRIGCYQEGKNELFELMISQKEGTSYPELIRNMRHYTKKLDQNVSII